MGSKLAFLITCLCLTVLSAGCKGGGGSSLGSFFGGNESIVVNLPNSGSSGGDSGSVYDGGSGSSDPVGGVSNPEPATLGLLGSGLFAYAFLKRKKKKR